MTPKQLESLHDVLEGDVEMFDGYEELPNDCQEKVKRALENGHVDDEDWKGVMFPCPQPGLNLTGIGRLGCREKPSGDERVPFASC